MLRRRCEKLIDAAASMSVRHPPVVVGIALLICSVLASQIPNLKMDSGIKSMFSRRHEGMKRLIELEQEFNGVESIAVLISSSSGFSPALLDLLDSIAADISQIPGIGRVNTLTDIRTISRKGGELNIEPAVSESFDEFRRRAMATRTGNSLFRSLAARDGKTFAVIGAVLPDADDANLHNAIDEIVADYRQHYPEFSFSYTGMPLIRAAISENLWKDVMIICPIGAVAILLFLSSTFRTLIGAFLPLLVVVMSVLSVLGLMAIVGQPFTLASLLIPVCLLAVGNNYSIHILAEYFRSRKGTPCDKAARSAVREVGYPVLITAMTSALGFASLVFHDLKPTRMAGLFTSLGVMVAFLLSITFVPACLCIIDLCIIDRNFARPNVDKKKRHLDGLPETFIRNRRWISGFCLVGMALLGIGAGRLKVDASPISYLNSREDVVVGTHLMNSELGGAIPFSILFEDDPLSRDNFETMERLRLILLDMPQVGLVMSPTDVIMDIHSVVTGSNAPLSTEMIAQYMLLQSVISDSDTQNLLINYDHTKAQIIAYARATRSSEVAAIIEQVRNSLPNNGSTPVIAGFAVLYSELSRLIARGQLFSLTFSMTAIFSLLCLAFRSIWLGSVCLMPFLTALITVFGVMGYTGITLSIIATVIAGVTVGVGVDYAIHVVSRFQSERMNAADLSRAMINAILKSGRPLTLNASSVIVGFSAGLVSRFQPVVLFSLLTIASIAICYFSAIMIIPIFISSRRGG